MIEDGVKPTNFTLTVMIKRFGREGELDKALGVLKKMKEQGPYPDNMPYEKIISGYMRNGEALQAYELVREAYALDGQVTKADSYRTSGAVTPGGSLAHRGLSLDTKILERLIELLGTKGMAESHAVPLVQELRKQKVNIPQRLVACALRGATSGGSFGQQG